MPDTKSGREKQARTEERRQAQRDISEARERADEMEPPDDTPTECYRRGCSEPAAFSVTERYLEDTGKGAVEATALLCVDHTVAEGPANLDRAYDEYVFRIDPIEGVDVELDA
ncbi:hypothetical protein [Halorubrum trueperi]|uniref:Halobacterial output domain-containing protein n=1 Tax=Halorubrum trueperi TaxID=2004704 RepID=A0ABD5UQA1_9EURY